MRSFFRDAYLMIYIGLAAVEITRTGVVADSKKLWLPEHLFRNAHAFLKSGTCGAFISQKRAISPVGTAIAS
jgi:hypothetical protein